MKPAGHSRTIEYSMHIVLAKMNNYAHEEVLKQWKLYAVRVDDEHLIGFVPQEYAVRALWDEAFFETMPNDKAILLKAPQTTKPIKDMNKGLEKFCKQNRHQEGFRHGLRPWFEDKETGMKVDFHPILSARCDLNGLKVPSPIRGILGILTAGVHVNVYSIREDQHRRDEVEYIWVSERSSLALTYRGCYDQIVAGGMNLEDGMNPMLTLEREAKQEAGLILNIEEKCLYDECGDTVGEVQDAGRIYFCIKKDRKAGNEEVGHIEPGMRFCFDVEVPRDLELAHNEDSIKSFTKLTVDEVVQSLAQYKWKPNSALVMADFLRRRGKLGNKEMTRNALEMLQKKPPLPMPRFSHSG
jgi:8-oxo-dGTP pyrophosphatase MutT (NUDIX family)